MISPDQVIVETMQSRDGPIVSDANTRTLESPQHLAPRAAVQTSRRPAATSEVIRLEAIVEGIKAKHEAGRGQLTGAVTVPVYQAITPKKRASKQHAEPMLKDYPEKQSSKSPISANVTP
jgi:hypothetical protein